MHILIAVAIALVVGAGLTYGFRGWIARTKAKESAALQQSAQAAANKAQSAVGGFIKKL